MYVSPKQQQHADGRDEQDRNVRMMLDRMSSLSRPKRPTMPRVSTVWNECLQRYVEMR